VDKFKFERVLAGETQWDSMDKRFMRKDGEVIFASISANSICKDNESVDHFVVFFQGINEHKQAEELTKHMVDSKKLKNWRISAAGNGM
jgi:PAS domain S-box-containing protein